MLQQFAHNMVSSLLGMEQGPRLSAALEFFIYCVARIFFLLSVIIFIVSVIRSRFPPERTKRILSHKKEFIGNILAVFVAVPGLIVNGKVRHSGKPLPGLRRLRN